jgi:hypothetical protein
MSTHGPDQGCGSELDPDSNADWESGPPIRIQGLKNEVENVFFSKFYFTTDTIIFDLILKICLQKFSCGSGFNGFVDPD